MKSCCVFMLRVQFLECWETKEIGKIISVACRVRGGLG